MTVLGVAPLIALTGLVGLPLAARSVKVLRANYLHKMRMVPANIAMIKVHFLTGAGMIGAYLAYAVERGLLKGFLG